MQKIQLHLIAFFFGALLPAKDDNEEGNDSYYKCLNISPEATPDEIKKAFRKKSLQHHPDKVAQFARNSNKTPEEIQAEFLIIKDAYDALSDPKRRNAYDVFGKEGEKLWTSLSSTFKSAVGGEGGGDDNVNPIDAKSIVDNLSNASCVDRSKLFFYIFLLIALVLLGPILICVKADSGESLNNLKWTTVFVPIWIHHGLLIAASVFGKSWWSVLKLVCVSTSEILLALRWDDSPVTKEWNYALILIPLYLHQALIAIAAIVLVRTFRRDVARMVTMEYLETQILPNFTLDSSNNHMDTGADVEAVPRRSYQDLTEEEREAISEKYIFITVDPDASNPYDNERDGDADISSDFLKLKFRYSLENSPEYKVAESGVNACIDRIASFIFFRIPFLILLVMKLDGGNDWNWNVVFIPIWVEVLGKTCTSFFRCCASVRETQDENMQVVVGGGNGNDSDDEKENTTSQQEIKNLLRKKRTDDSSTFVRNTDEAVHQPAHNDQSDDADDDINEPNPENIAKVLSSCGSCCYFSFLVMVLTLFVVKLNRATDTTGGLNYSSFWLLTPLFLVAACTLSSFARCIFIPIDINEAEEVEDPEDNDGLVAAGADTDTSKVVDNQTILGKNKAKEGDIEESKENDQEESNGFDDLD